MPSERRVETSSGLEIELPSTRIKTLAQLVAACDVDESIWRVKSFECTKWDMGSVPRAVGSKETGWRRESTTPVVTELYRVRATFERKIEIQAIRAEIAALVADAQKHIPARPFLGRSRRPAAVRRPPGVMIEMSLYDVHAGKLSWPAETGHGPYDSKIAIKRIDDAVESLVARTQHHRIERIVFTIGNDLLNADNDKSETTAGTRQDGDSRHKKTFIATRLAVCRAIDRLSTIAPVLVPVVPGNHDTETAWYLGDSLEQYYRHTKHVTIDNAPTLRKYVQHGRVMLMLTHGDKGKRPDYRALIAVEQPDMWAATRFREVHTGHVHAFGVDEKLGVRIRTMPALCEPEAWHAGNGYVGNLQQAIAIVWHPLEGEIGSATYTPADSLQRIGLLK